jgi:death-on-curing protein
VTPAFLIFSDVLEIHRNQIELYGGTNGIRDHGLLESALSQPEVSFGGDYLHETIFYMASAYAYHICRNHPFLDGNKRVALAAALVFLELNGISIEDPDEKLYDAVINIATGVLSKVDLASLLRSLPTT